MGGAGFVKRAELVAVVVVAAWGLRSRRYKSLIWARG